MDKTLRWVFLVAAMAALAMTIVACGGSDSTTIIPATPPVGCEAGKTAPDIAVDANNGNDSYAGTCALPYSTISAALAASSSGDVVWVNTGTYDDQNGDTFPLVVPAGVSLIGDVDNNGDGGTATLISGKGLLAGSILNGGLFAREGSSVSGFSFDTEGSATFVFSVIINDTSATISNNTFLLGAYGGIYTEGTGDSLIEKNVISANSYGVYLYGTGVTTVQDNSFPDATFGVDNARGDNIIRRNTFSSYGDIGIQVQGVGTSPVIENNEFTSYVYLSSSGSPVLRDNTFTMNNGPLVTINGSANPDMGTAVDPGGNVFTVSSSGADVQHNSSATVLAIGNTWTATPPVCSTNIIIGSTGSLTWGTGGGENCP